MNELTTLAKLTAIEARQKVNNVKSCLSIARNELLDLRDRKGWLALGFESWEQYGEKEWNYSKSQLDRLATAYEIEQSLNSPIGETIPEQPPIKRRFFNA